MAGKEKIVLAYSGGLDTSVAIKWQQDNYNYDVIAVAIDVGEGKDLEFTKQKALDLGAIESHVVDATEVFADEYILPALKANALYEGQYPIVSALSRPLITKLLVDIARKSGASAVAHGCTGKGNDQVRFDVSFAALAPDLKIVAPVREWGMSRDEEFAYAEKHNVPIPVDKDKPYSIDQNMWGRACEAGVLEDPWVEPPEDAYELTVALSETPAEPDEITIDFEAGKPIKLNGEKLSLAQMILKLNKIAGKHGIGRLDMIENRLVGIKSREVYEIPAAAVLIAAHKGLECLVQTRDLMHFKPVIEQKIADMIYEGQWYSPLMEGLFSFVEATQKDVSGTVRLKLFKGHAIVVGRKSPNSIYSYELATYDANDRFDHQAALGFIKLWGLQTKTYAEVKRGK
jgi:argininosuccinate synthase